MTQVWFWLDAFWIFFFVVVGKFYWNSTMLSHRWLFRFKQAMRESLQFEQFIQPAEFVAWEFISGFVWVWILSLKQSEFYKLAFFHMKLRVSFYLMFVFYFLAIFVKLIVFKHWNKSFYLLKDVLVPPQQYFIK